MSKNKKNYYLLSSEYNIHICNKIRKCNILYFIFLHFFYIVDIVIFLFIFFCVDCCAIVLFIYKFFILCYYKKYVVSDFSNYWRDYSKNPIL
jgi:hypothetical protein